MKVRRTLRSLGEGGWKGFGEFRKIPRSFAPRSFITTFALLCFAVRCATPIGVSYVDRRGAYHSLTTNALSAERISSFSARELINQALSETPIADGVIAHSIVGVEGDGPPADGGDGVVKYSSAHIDGVASEKIVRSAHSMQGNPETIQEVKRILIEHAKNLR